VHVDGLSDCFVLPVRCWAAWFSLRCLDVVRWCEVQAQGPDMSTPFIKLVGVATFVASVVAPG
jgi:hypothetical protein